eukprot:90893-Alexandrium_andersonii.AAC.1
MGFEKLDLLDAWREHLDRGWQRRALTWIGQDPGERQVALQLAERRQPARMPRAPAGPGQATIVAEWRGTLGSYATAARRLGCQAYLHTVDG